MKIIYKRFKWSLVSIHISTEPSTIEELFMQLLRRSQEFLTLISHVPGCHFKCIKISNSKKQVFTNLQTVPGTNENHNI